MGWFGSGKKAVWLRLSEQLGGEYVPRTLFRVPRVRLRVEPWTLTLDTFVLSGGHAHIECSRIRAPFLNPSGFRFRVKRRTPWDLRGFLVPREIETGDPLFDEEFLVKGNDPDMVREFLSDWRIRTRLIVQASGYLSVRRRGGWSSWKYPPDVDELNCWTFGVITDVDRLKNLFFLFGAILERLCLIGAASRQDPHVEL